MTSVHGQVEVIALHRVPDTCISRIQYTVSGIATTSSLLYCSDMCVLRTRRMKRANSD
jgi:uncharacterized membrane protein YuzA (DUF378 family)